MKPPTTSRCRLKWVLLLLFCIPILLLIASELGFFPWSRINCSQDDVDIRTGRIRHTRYLFFIPIESKVEDSVLTKALLPEDLVDLKAEWHRSLTLSPGLRHSPHYNFHSAIAQMNALAVPWKVNEFTPSARRISAKRVLQLWQESGDDGGVNNYIRALNGLAFPDDGSTKKIDVQDLPKQ